MNQSNIIPFNTTTEKDPVEQALERAYNEMSPEDRATLDAKRATKEAFYNANAQAIRYHQAGHAVMATLAGYPLKSVYVLPDVAGMTFNDIKREENELHVMCIALAGPRAHLAFAPDRIPAEYHERLNDSILLRSYDSRPYPTPDEFNVFGWLNDLDQVCLNDFSMEAERIVKTALARPDIQTAIREVSISLIRGKVTGRLVRHLVEMFAPKIRKPGARSPSKAIFPSLIAA
jgi:hypothetical protein